MSKSKRNVTFVEERMGKEEGKHTMEEKDRQGKLKDQEICNAFCVFCFS